MECSLDGTLARGLHVLVVTNGWPTQARPSFGIFTKRQVDGLRQAGVEVTVLFIDGSRRAEYLRAARSVLGLNWGARRYDLVHAYTGHCGLLACLQFRYPIVMSYVGYDLDAHLGEAETIRTTIERVAFRWLSVLVAATIAQSTRGARRLPGLGARRNTVLSNGIDRDHFRPMHRDEARTRLGWMHDDPVVLFAAEPARKEKRFELCRQAVTAAQRKIQNLRLEVAGNVLPELMPLWYSACDVLAMTSVAEGSPNVVKEALACALPVVSVNVGDVVELIGGASQCHICPPRADALGEAIVRVVSRMPARSDGRDLTERLSMPHVNERLLEIYADAIKRGPGALGCLPVITPACPVARG